MENVQIMRAAKEDAQAVYALYHSLIGMPYSTWSEEYPSKDLVFKDAASGNTLIMRDPTGRILAAIGLFTQEDEPEIVNAAPWYDDVTRWALLARLGVAADVQGRGIAKQMLKAAMEAACAEGCEAVRFLVAKSNPIAQRAYAALGFDVCAEAEIWEPGEVWLCYEKRLAP